MFTIKAASAETAGALAIWDVTTRKGEEPNLYMHDEDEIFYALSGSLTFHCDGKSFKVKDKGFVFLPRGIPHRYTIDSEEARLIGLSTPSEFDDYIERTGKLMKLRRSRNRTTPPRTKRT